METAEKEEALYEEGTRRLNVSGVLRILGVSRSGYHAFKRRCPSDREKRKEAIKANIRHIYDASYQNYGAPKITQILQQQGETIAEKTVGNYMREMGIQAQYVKPYTVTTVGSTISEELMNIVNGEFNPVEPNAVWCSDITYIYTSKGFVYLTSIMDLYSRKIISWVLSTTLEAHWVIEAITKAKAVRTIDKPLILHSDRGIQYTCAPYQEVTETGITTSYSKKAYPWDNACIESFHALIKREWIHRFKIADYNHAYRLVFTYIEAFYNTVRIHSHCGYLSPNQYEALYKKELDSLCSQVC